MIENPHSNASALQLARNLFPHLAQQVDAAYARHAIEGPVTDFAPDDQELDRVLDARAAELKAPGGALSGIAFAGLSDPAAQIKFESAFTAAVTAAEWISLSVPEPETFESAGVDLDKLARAMRADQTLLPVPAPHGLGVAQWQKLFRSAAAMPGSPLQAVSDEAQTGSATSPLTLSSEVMREFSVLDAVQDTETPVVLATDAHGEKISWTLRLIPADERPQTLGLSFAHGPHLSLPEMLMLQLIRVVNGEPLVDSTCFTWISGVLGGGKLAARHVYDTAECAIRISCRELGNQGPHLGSRTPQQ